MEIALLLGCFRATRGLSLVSFIFINLATNTVRRVSMSEKKAKTEKENKEDQGGHRNGKENLDDTFIGATPDPSRDDEPRQRGPRR